MIAVDVLMPTNRKRLWNFLFQLRGALANALNIRVTVAMSGPWPELRAELSARELEKVRWVENAPDGTTGDPFNNPNGYMGAPKIRWCLENLDWANWMYQVCDDDALMPWGIEALFAATDNMGVVIGQVLPVSRNEHLDFTPYKIGRSIERCRVSCAGALINMRLLETLPKPWYNERSGYADWELIERMSTHFPSKIIKTVVHVLALCELGEVPSYLRATILEHIKIKGDPT